MAWALQQFRNWCRPKRQAFSWFSPKENHTSRSFSVHSNCETALAWHCFPHPLRLSSHDICEIWNGVISCPLTANLSRCVFSKSFIMFFSRTSASKTEEVRGLRSDRPTDKLCANRRTKSGCAEPYSECDYIGIRLDQSTLFSPGVSPLRPPLRAMQNAGDMDNVAGDDVDHQVR